MAASKTQATPEVISWIAANLDGLLTVVAVGVIGSIGWLSVRLGITFWESKISHPQAEQKAILEVLTAKVSALEKENTELRHEQRLQSIVIANIQKQNEQMLNMMLEGHKKHEC